MKVQYAPVKRAADLTAASALTILTAPVQLAVGIAVLVTMGRPVFFRQFRPGKDGDVFELLKFRTMATPKPGLEEDADRLTPLGRLLRSTSLDELPSLWNVIRGDMSLVGPRPLLPDYLTLYNARQARRHEVRPGITGLAQVSGRNLVSWADRLEMDVQYVDRVSAKLDAKILIATVSTVLSRRGVSGDGVATMSRFTGQDAT
ncbi:sugar transferase [Propionibacteriaceae bacterium Y1685]|uniref:sugar transferase n=1 Tax=Microlunatus sp. Y1700 TaxID=3418487 RepID=UPI003B7E7B9F